MSFHRSMLARQHRDLGSRQGLCETAGMLLANVTSQAYLDRATYQFIVSKTGTDVLWPMRLCHVSCVVSESFAVFNIEVRTQNVQFGSLRTTFVPYVA